jgi:cell fate regulator YaaT (PSP1 superfamily)
MSKIFEVEFQGGRRSFYANPQEFPFVVGDLAIVQAEKGEDLGRVVNMGSLVDQRAGSREYALIIRKPSKKDLTQMEENQKLEREAFFD